MISAVSNLLKRKCMSEVARIGSVIIFHLRKLWKAKFSILCDVMFPWSCRGNLTLITFKSEREIRSLNICPTRINENNNIGHSSAANRSLTESWQVGSSTEWIIISQPVKFKISLSSFASSQAASNNHCVKLVARSTYEKWGAWLLILKYYASIS